MNIMIKIIGLLLIFLTTKSIIILVSYLLGFFLIAVGIYVLKLQVDQFHFKNILYLNKRP